MKNINKKLLSINLTEQRIVPLDYSDFKHRVIEELDDRLIVKCPFCCKYAVIIKSEAPKLYCDKLHKWFNIQDIINNLVKKRIWLFRN